jgi:sugar-specific transcriptional regulator TrmB
MIDKELAKLGLHAEETKAFLFLLENPGQPVGVLAKKTGISRPSLYGFLKKLQEKGLITQSLRDGVKIFSPVTQEKINMVIDERIKDLEQTKSFLQNAFLDIQQGKTPVASPRMQIFEGNKEVKFSPRDILLYRNIQVKSYWPIKLMLEVLGEEFFSEFNKERLKRNISIQAIWPEKHVVDIKTHPYLGVGESFKREIRLAPKEIDFSMGYWIYEDKVLFVSSKKNNFSFILECKEFAEMLSSQFDVVWGISKTIKVDPKHTESFFEGNK